MVGSRQATSATVVSRIQSGLGLMVPPPEPPRAPPPLSEPPEPPGTPVAPEPPVPPSLPQPLPGVTPLDPPAVVGLPRVPEAVQDPSWARAPGSLVSWLSLAVFVVAFVLAFLLLSVL